MITHLAIGDFQSLVDVDLELGPFTVIVGPGNSGKTASVRALKALALNRTGSDFIRRGAGACAVVCFTDDGHEIAWIKDEKSARYTVDGQELTKLAGAVPAEVSDALAIRRIEVEQGLTAFPQVHSQFDSPFLLAETAGRAARIIAKLTRLEVIVGAEVAVARDLKRIAADLRREQITLEEAEAALEPATQTAVAAEQVAQRARTLYDEVADLEARCNDGLAAAERIEEQRAIATITLPEPATFTAVSADLMRLFNSLGHAERLSNAKGELETATAQLIDAGERLTEALAALDAIDVCPLCRQPLKGELAHAGHD